MFRFTIRDVLWLMAVVGLGVAWGIEHRQLVVVRGALYTEQAERRIADLRALELQSFLPRAIDE